MRKPLSKEKKIAQKLEMSLYIVLALELLLGILTVLVWRYLCVGCGLPFIAYGILHVVSAHKRWDRFHTFEVGGEADTYTHRHVNTIVHGVFWIVVGVAVSVALLLMILGVISV